MIAFTGNTGISSRRGGVVVIAALALVGARADGARALDPAAMWAATFRVELRGDTSCAYGDPGCSVCVDDVRGTFAAMSPGLTARYRFRTPLSYGAQSHVEGYARLPGSPGENWVLVAKMSESVAASVAAMSLSQIENDYGDAFVDPFGSVDRDAYLDAEAPDDALQHILPFYGSRHVGGISMLGALLVAPAECNDLSEVGPDGVPCAGPWVDFVTYPNDTWPPEPHRESRLRAPGGVGSKAHYATAVRLANGYTFVIINRSDTGDFDTFISDSATLSSARWIYTGRLNFKSSFPGWNGGEGGDNYQSGSLITECGTGDIFLMVARQTNGTDWRGENDVDLFVLAEGEDELSVLGLAASRSLSLAELESHPGLATFTHRTLVLDHEDSILFDDEDVCRTRAGGSVHVTPDHSMTYNCAVGHNSGTIGDPAPAGWLRAGEVAPSL